MDKAKLHRFCLALMALSILTRLGAYLAAWASPAEEPAPELYRVDIESAPMAVPLVHTSPVPSGAQDFVEDAPALDTSAPLPEDLEVSSKIEPDTAGDTATETLDAPRPLVFSALEAESITIAGQCSYEVDKASLLLRPSTLDFSGPGPAILIVHTHASEAYTPEDGLSYIPSDTLRTEDAERSVIRLGSEIADILNEAGIETIHDTTLNDYPNYDGSYERMRKIIEGYLAQYPSIQMVIDVHRDAFEDADGNPAALTINIEGEQCAKLMLVVGTDEGGLYHPDWQENLANALKLQALLNRRAPGLCRNLDLRTERFNQHETPGSILCEFGASGNTLTQALSSARIFAQALVQLANSSGAENF